MSISTTKGPEPGLRKPCTTPVGTSTTSPGDSKERSAESHRHLPRHTPEDLDKTGMSVWSITLDARPAPWWCRETNPISVTGHLGCGQKLHPLGGKLQNDARLDHDEALPAANSK